MFEKLKKRFKKPVENRDRMIPNTGTSKIYLTVNKKDIFRDILLGYTAIMSTLTMIFSATSNDVIAEQPTVIATVEAASTEEESTTCSVETVAPTTVSEPEPTTEEETTTMVAEEVTTTQTSKITVTDEEVELLALVMLAEAEGESELGRRLVVDTILNRVDSERHPNSIRDVIFQKGQFTSMWNGRTDRVTITDEARQLVRDEVTNRTNYDVIYFKMYGYHKWGTPLFQEGCHYFSSY